MKKPNGSYISKKNKSKGKPHFYIERSDFGVYWNYRERISKSSESFCDYMDSKL